MGVQEFLNGIWTFRYSIGIWYVKKIKGEKKIFVKRITNFTFIITVWGHSSIM